MDNTTLDNTTLSPLHEMEDQAVNSPGWVAFTAFKALITIIGLLSNITTFVTLKLNSKGFSTVSRTVLQNQAIADSFVCIMGIGLYTQNPFWLTANHGINSFICQVWHSQAIYWSGVLLSVWNVVFITIERFILINYPFKHRDILPKHIYLAFAIMNILCILLIIPAYLMTKYDEESSRCLLKPYFSSPGFGIVLQVLMYWWFTISYAVPVGIFIGLYTKTLSTLRQRQEKLKEINQESRVLKVADQQLTRTAGAVAIVFVIALSWDAWFCVLSTLFDNIDYEFNSTLQVLGVFFADLNSCANPFIYATFMPAFRRSLTKTFRFRKTINDGEASTTLQCTTMNQTNRNTSKATSS